MSGHRSSFSRRVARAVSPSLTIVTILATLPARAGNRSLEHWPVEPRLAWLAHQGTTHAVEFLPDGKRVVSVGADSVARLWDAATGRPIREYSVAPASVHTLALSADGRRVALAGRDEAVRVFDVATGDVVALLEPFPQGVASLRFRADGALVVGGRDGFAVWDVENEKTLSRTEPLDRGFAFAIAADGKTAAFADRDGGRLYAYDLDARRITREVAAPAAARAADVRTSLSPDGRLAFLWVLPAGRADAVTYGWDLTTGKPLPLPPEVATALTVSFSRDGRRALVNGGLSVASGRGGDVTVMDCAPAGGGRWRAIARLGAGFPESHARAFAFSPDGRSVVAGTGDRDVNAETPGPGSVQLFDVPDANPGPALVPGPAVGTLSWDVLPVTVRRLDGETVPLDRLAYRGEWLANHYFEPRVRRLADGLDAAWWASSVCLMRKPGTIEEVLHDPNEAVTDVAWDGRHLWVASTLTGVTVLDAGGRVVARVGKDQGLPPSDAVLLLHAVRPGRVIATGASETAPGAAEPADGLSAPGSGWCAAIDFDPATAAGTVKPIVLESQLPKDWPRAKLSHNQSVAAMHPRWIVEGPAAGDGVPRTAWVGTMPARGTPLIRVDVEQLTWSAHNTRTGPGTFGSLDPPVIYGRHLLAYEGHGLLRYDVGPGGAGEWNDRVDLVAPRTMEPELVGIGTAAFLAGRWWYGVDLPSGRHVPLGPGLEVDGVRLWGHVTYYASGLGGVAALSHLDGAMYRFSADANKPAAVRPRAWAPAPAPSATGAVLPLGRQVHFARGGGALTFRDGVPLDEPPVALRSTAAAIRQADLLRYLDREIPLIDDLPLDKLRAANQAPRAPTWQQFDAPRRDALSKLYAAYAAAGPVGSNPTGPAAEPLLAEAERAARAVYDARHARVSAIRAALGPEAWGRAFPDAPDLRAELDLHFPPKP
jgi:WD40 repeat protein